jgi:hypothetical protein
MQQEFFQRRNIGFISARVRAGLLGAVRMKIVSLSANSVMGIESVTFLNPKVGRLCYLARGYFPASLRDGPARRAITCFTSATVEKGWLTVSSAALAA